jgi:tetratricopeptide (TPR) repeat protein
MTSLPQPSSPEAFAEALAFHRDGRLEEAASRYEAALGEAPKHFEALHFLGLVRIRQGRHDEAQKLLRKALNQNPGSAEVNNSLGFTLAAQGRHDEATARYDKALALKPDFPQARNNLGIALADLGRHEAAMAEYRQAIALEPGYAEALANLGVSLAALGRPAEAIPNFEAALARRPGFAEAALNLGNAQFALGAFADAIASYERAIAAAPGSARAYNNLGRALEALNRHEEAILCYAKAAALAPDYAGAQWNLALAHLALGDFAEGWPRYEWRWRNGDLTPRGFARPLWRGEDIGGRTILVHAEQGLGDTLHFVRYLPLLARRGARVLLEAPLPLLPLLAGLDGLTGLFAAREELPDFDCHVPLLSLPGAFTTTLDTLPRQVPYLAPPADRVARWRAVLAPLAALRIGIAWAGSATNSNDRNRSLPLDRLRPLLELPGIGFVSLQKELRPGDADLLASSPGLLALGDRLEDFADTAAVASLLDLVIAVDTSVAHLAGALGRPVWIMLPFAAEWRWLRQREDSPWYPTARLFRQDAPGDWAGLVARLVAAVRALPPQPGW